MIFRTDHGAHDPDRARPRTHMLACLLPAVGLLTAAAAQGGSQDPGTVAVTVRVDRPGARIPSTLFGLFFEDINFGADGGLNPERVKNGSFAFPEPLMGWKCTGGAEVLVERAGGTNQSPHVRAPAGAAIVNQGFRGVGVEKGAVFDLTFRGRRAGPGRATVRGTLRDASGKGVGECRVSGFADDWKDMAVSLRAVATEAKGSLELEVTGGAVELDDISLYPRENWGKRKRGLRPDLVKLLKELQPGFLRFPGGCIVEGRTLEQRYQWKTTIGPVRDRRLLVNRWNTEFRHKPTPDYYQSFGIGFFEYFQLCEDIGAEPLPVLNCGMACQFNSGELAPLDSLSGYVQDALDLVEFANGPVTSEWGRRRAEMGHPAPFGLKYIGVGNEQWGPDYIPRYEAFARGIKRRHPEIQLVASAGPSPDGPRFDFLWSKMRELKADIVDEHYYMGPKWFRDNAGRYDSYPRTGPRVFAGEYAAQSVGVVRPENRNNWECALSEAAFITGLERNADVVHMTSYAPLFAHVDAWQWSPNLIWFDNLRSYGTPNYYVQKLFSTNPGSTSLPVNVDGSARNGQAEIYSSAALDESDGVVILKLINTRAAAREVRVELAGATYVGPEARLQVLAAADPTTENSLDQPLRLSPVAGKIRAGGSSFGMTLPPSSMTVLRVVARSR